MRLLTPRDVGSPADADRRRSTLAGAIAGLRRYSAWFAIALVAFGFAELAMFGVERSEQRWQEHSRDVQRVARSALSVALERNAATTEYLVTGDSAVLRVARTATPTLAALLDSLVTLTADNSDQQRRAKSADSAMRAWDAAVIAPVLAGSGTQPRPRVIASERYAAVRAAFTDFLSAEEVLHEQRRNRANFVSLLALVGMLLPSGILAALVVGTGRRFAAQGERLTDQQLQLEEQAVELEQHVHELEMANTELAEAVEQAREAREVAEREGRERRRNAALLDAALVSAPVAISILDRDLRYVLVNSSTAEMTGIPIEAHLGKTLREVNPALNPDMEVALRRVIDTGEPMRNLEIVRNAPGVPGTRQRHLLLNAYPVRSEDGASLGLGVAAVDTTEQRELLEQFHHAQKLEAVGRLAAGIAHDFNNLLTVIRSYCDLALLEMPEGAPGRDEIREVRAAGERAGALARQMVALSRKQVIIPRALPVGEAMREMESMLRRVTGDTVELRFDLDEPLGIVHIDPTHLEQVMMNLVINAVDAMPTGGTLTIGATNVTIDVAKANADVGVRAGPHVVITVRDTGTGIDPDTLRNIFDPFFTTKPQGKGTGLGLSTVYGIVRDAGGHVRVESVVGAGTTFLLYLPAEVMDGSPALRQRSRPEGVPAIAGGAETVLVVEDEDALRASVARGLRRHGYTVLEAAHAGEAMRVALEHKGPIHALLSDFHMPGMHGRQLADRLRVERPALKVLFMSGSSAELEEPSERVADPHPFIGKPFTLDELARRLREALDG